jgi:hypothetical protein
VKAERENQRAIQPRRCILAALTPPIMSTPFKLQAADRHFLSQAADPDLRKREIARLIKVRRVSHLLVGLFILMTALLGLQFAFIVCTSHVPISDRDISRFLFIAGITVLSFLVQTLSYYNAQNQLRLLLLAERLTPSAAHP